MEKSNDLTGREEPRRSKSIWKYKHRELAVTLYYGALSDLLIMCLSSATPEPGSMLLLGLGVMGIGILRRRH